ncbi:MAG: protease SohB [Gammaproteobacteria bacterium]|jgi:serine protease SohB|nr:protease SohB [Chromatiales bacterium]MCP4926623.1 protease SohB [Gammaproteobacteria bacterium]MDP7153965.1 protease SohB [Gammaproteobacteria bacterium]MDP7297576.1 protease SohB [Gammaproteobacteria bacterium]MDP7418334.1 protease SohB [Gammaproteobacteria bacterium]
MADFFIDYGLFLAKAVTVVVAIGIVLVLIAGFSRRASGDTGLEIKKLNDKLKEAADVVRRAMLNKAAWKKHEKAEKKERKLEEKSATEEDDHRKRIFVLDFKGDIRASGVASLREEISAVISTASENDEVIMRLENPGGAVHEHGLAASQLLRIKNHGVPLTVIVDKVAASGGYLMACIANRIIAAQFAVIGSIGVIAQLPNFNRALESRGVDFEQVTAGKYKRTVTMFGKNTDEDRAKLKEELEDVHVLFKGLVAEHRPSLDIERVATGEHWYGADALKLGLIDELGTSDDYLMVAAQDADVYTVKFKGKQSIQERLMSSFESSLDRLGLRLEEWLGRNIFR